MNHQSENETRKEDCMDNRPIGFLDSGVGGLTVVRELMRQLSS